MEDLVEGGRMRAVARGVLWGGMALVLSLPAFAMMLGAEGVDWDERDFLVMGAMLGAVGVGIEAAVRFLRRPRSRWLAIGVVLTVFLLAWAELAVGIVGSPWAGS